MAGRRRPCPAPGPRAGPSGAHFPADEDERRWGSCRRERGRPAAAGGRDSTLGSLTLSPGRALAEPVETEVRQADTGLPDSDPTLVRCWEQGPRLRQGCPCCQGALFTVTPRKLPLGKV